MRENWWVTNENLETGTRCKTGLSASSNQEPAASNKNNRIRMGFQARTEMRPNLHNEAGFLVAPESSCCQSSDGGSRAQHSPRSIDTNSEPFEALAPQGSRLSPPFRNHRKYAENLDIAKYATHPLESLSLDDALPKVIEVKNNDHSRESDGLDVKGEQRESSTVSTYENKVRPMQILSSHGTLPLIEADEQPRVLQSESQSHRSRSHREQFLLFIKILFKCLDQANEPEKREKAKKIVAECTRRNRAGDPDFSPLMEAVEKRLRGFVGEMLWRRAHLLLRHYVNKRNDATSNSPFI